MRLLQLGTGPDELIDLHPNVTVVTGLEAEGRGLLYAAVQGLARGEATGGRGLLEAYGVLFDLTPEMVALVEMTVDDLRPVVSPADLRSRPQDPLALQRAAAEQALAEADARWAAADAADRRARGAASAATEALARARRGADTAEADIAARIGFVDMLTAELDQAAEERRRLTDARAELGRRVAQATTERAEAEVAAAERRDARHRAAARAAQSEAPLDRLASSLDPEADHAAEQAVTALAEVEAQVDAQVAAERTAALEQVAAVPVESPADRLGRVQREIDELDQELAAFGATPGRHRVEEELERARSVDPHQLVPCPKASALADELEALEVRLRVTPEVSSGRAEGRVRLDDARQALLEAEESVRKPELDRDAVDQLEVAHADLLDAIDKADSRFGGARAQRRVEAARTAEQALLDLLGLTSYLDFMVGYSLLHVDPAKEAHLDAARLELSAAEDCWHALEAEAETAADADAELARAELMARRRLLIEEARAQLAGPVPAESLVDELHALRVPAAAPTAVTDGLRRALEAAGAALGEDALDLGDLLLVAEVWLAETAEADEREAAADADRLAGAAVTEAEAALAGAVEHADALTDELHRLDERLAQAELNEAASEAQVRSSSQAAAAPPLEGLAAVTAAEGAASAAQEVADRAMEVLRVAEVQRHDAVAALEAMHHEHGGIEEDASGAEEIEWYLLARLAAQRSVSLAGSLPLVLDDALGGLGEADLEHVLDRLERVAEAVQVILVTDDPRADAWARRAGADRAAVVSPQPV